MSLQYIRNIKINNVRGYAAAAAVKPKSETASSQTPAFKLLPREEIKTTVVNNVVVSSCESNKPLGRLAVYYKAGPRYENVNNQGVVHALRYASGLSTNETSHFGLTRNIEQCGGNFYCTTGREHVAYTLETTRNQIDKLQDIIRDATARQVFKRWELSDDKARLKLDLFGIPNEVRVLEKLHKVAFRRGLGNSLYMPKCMFGKHSSEMLNEYVKNNFVEATVVGVGVPHDICERLAKRLRVEPGERMSAPSKFHGGEVRKEIGEDLAYVALAIEGAGFKKGKEMIASALASRALGAGPRTKRGNYVGAKLSTAQMEGSECSSFSSNYSDSGLLGVLVVGLPNVIASATKKAANILRGSTFTEEDIARAKTILKADLGFSLETEVELADDMGLQSLFNGQVHSFEEILQLIDTVSAADVNNLVKKGGGKLAVSSIGNVINVPYLDELDT